MTFQLLPEYIYFVNHRHHIHLSRAAGRPAPWTSDNILRTYRFCNMRREDDRVTQWIHKHWLREDPHAWLAMYVARVFNNPATLAAIGYPMPWTPKRHDGVVRVCELRTMDGTRVFNPAYRVVSAARKGPTLLTYCGLFDDAWKRRREIDLRKLETLQDLLARLLTFEGLGTFLAAQVIADVKWLPSMRTKSDWYTFAASGPGSRRGLNRLCGHPAEQSWRESEWHATLLELRVQILPKLHKDLRKLDAQNLQNTLCEFDKWCRVRFSEAGRPKQMFRASEVMYGK